MFPSFAVHYKLFFLSKLYNLCKYTSYSCISLLYFCKLQYNKSHSFITIARRGGAEVAGWTLDRKIRVRFPTYPHRVWALWWQRGKRRLRTSRCPCRGRLGTLKTPSCPWRGCPAAGQNLETGHLSRHYIAEISLNVTLNHNQLNSIHYNFLNHGNSIINKTYHQSLWRDWKLYWSVFVYLLTNI